jgi:hypothetical protein
MTKEEFLLEMHILSRRKKDLVFSYLSANKEFNQDDQVVVFNDFGSYLAVIKGVNVNLATGSIKYIVHRVIVKPGFPATISDTPANPRFPYKIRHATEGEQVQIEY